MRLLELFARWKFRCTHAIKSQQEVDSFYDGIAHPFDLRQKIKTYGFELLDEHLWGNWRKSPEESLAVEDKKILCGDFLELYRALYKKHNIQYDAYSAQYGQIWMNDYRLYYVSYFEYSGSQWLQGNNQIKEIECNSVSELLRSNMPGWIITKL